MTKPMPMLKTLFSACLSITTGFGVPELHGATAVRQGNLLIPESSQARTEDVGLRAHTNHVILAPEVARATPDRMESERDAADAQDEMIARLPFGSSSIEAEPDGATAKVALPSWGSPAALRSVYSLPSTGGAGVIAIVDAYDYPTAQHDLNTFSAQFGLPECTTTNGCFHQVYASGVKPAANCGWAQEEALDVEWAHAMAPSAKIVLVEAASNGSNDLAKAVDVASSIVASNAHGFGEVSMSWGFTEFSGETSLDSHFKREGVVYVASAGDVGGQRNYPAVSPYVVAAGGTTLHFSPQGKLVSESAWSSGGGGPSSYEARPLTRPRQWKLWADVAECPMFPLTPTLTQARGSMMVRLVGDSRVGSCSAAPAYRLRRLLASSISPATSTAPLHWSWTIFTAISARRISATLRQAKRERSRRSKAGTLPQAWEAASE